LMPPENGNSQFHPRNYSNWTWFRAVKVEVKV
jgi:hypothetical protein